MSMAYGPGTLLNALAFAADKHRHQRRKDLAASPYINHPIEVANLLLNQGGVGDYVVLSAAVLHDTIEDTATTAAEIEAHFGLVIAEVVVEVTDDKALDKQVRKQRQIDHAPYLSQPAKLVKLADKICNLRDILSAPPAGWSIERRLAYIAWAERVVAGLRGVHPVLETAFDDLLARQIELR